MGRLIGGRYRVEGELGGGAACCLRVTDTSSGSALALKRPAAGASARAAALFELEYQTLAGLKHPRILEVFEFGHDPGGAFYTMALVPGESLSQQGPLPFQEVCGYLRDAAEGLALLHVRRLLYRDVSPRNLWRTPDRRVQLCEFSGLAPFGSVEQAIGTPPYVPPEALQRGALDQRSDLFALGATAYYLLTGSHAYPAHDLRGLPAAWARPPVTPSVLVAALELSELAPIPPALDALVLALLAIDPAARPDSAETLIARLDALTDDVPCARSEAPELRLASVTFVGRVHERRTLRQQLQLACRGRGQSCVIEAAVGLGRSRLLRELADEAQAASAIVLHVDASWCEGPLGVAAALAQRLLDQLPSVAPELIASNPAAIAQMATRLREPLTSAGENIERRVRLQDALSAWLATIAERHTLAVLVDGLELTDEESLAVLLSLARVRHARRLLMVYTTRFSRQETSPAAERALVRLSRVVPLHPLSESESFELLRAVFGEVERLGRFAHQLHRVAHGNPEHLLELCGQLVRRAQVGFDAGAWVLPRTLSEVQLASSHDEAMRARLLFLSPGAREFGRMLSVHREVLPIEFARAVAASAPEDAFAHLGELLREGIVVREARGVRFTHEPLRCSLRAELEPRLAKKVQRVLGLALRAQPEARPVDLVRAGLYLLESDEAAGAEVFTSAARELALHDYDELRDVLPELEQGLALLRARSHSTGALVQVLAPLAIAGYYADHRYAARYGDESVALLTEYLGLVRAERLRRYLGRRLGLWVALLAAAVGRRMGADRCTPSTRAAFMLLFSCVATLTGTSVMCADPERASRYARALEPLTALGPNHLATFVHEFCAGLADTMREAFGSTLGRLRRILVRLESPKPIRGLPEEVRPRYLAGALYATGSLESLRDGGEALRIAEQLDRLDLGIARLSADQIRTMYHANQGNLSLFERYRELAEQHAIQLGTEWQTELWGALRLINAYLAMHDSIGLARVVLTLEGLTPQIPSLAPSLARARGAHAVIVGRPADALPLLAPFLVEEPRSSAGWGTSLGVLALAHNQLGDHAHARAACLRALAHVDVDDLAFPVVNLIVQCELMVAQAGLSELAEARATLDELLALHHMNEGPLTLGRLYEAGFRIELLAGDLERARLHLEQARHWYLPSGVPSLARHVERLERRLAAAESVKLRQGVA